MASTQGTICSSTLLTEVQLTNVLTLWLQQCPGAGAGTGRILQRPAFLTKQDEAAALARVRATGRRNRARRSASSGAPAATDAERQVTACAVTLPIECLV